MNILVLNCGSATVKFQAFAFAGGAPPRRLLRGAVSAIGAEARLTLQPEDGLRTEHPVPAADHAAAVRVTLDAVRSAGGVSIGAVGHRVVHGGPHHSAPARVQEALLSELAALEALAPLHNSPGITGIRAAQSALRVPMVAVFDTAFHLTLPESHWRYPIPYGMADQHGIRRYGFHGTSYRYVLRRWCELTGTPASQAHVVSLHLGNGASAAAIRHGRSIDTTMGMTPLEGLMMGTRSGDIDPSLPGILARRAGLNLGEVESLLNTQSGLLGISGVSNDMRVLLEAQAAHPRARLAIDMFCHRVRKAIGAALAVVGGARAVLFTGGIGENAAAVRAQVCANMDWCGLRLNAAANNAAVGGREGGIGDTDTPLAAWVIPTDEERMIAEDTATLVIDGYTAPP